MSTQPIKRAIEILGGAKALAGLLRVTPSAVYQWTWFERAISVKHAIAIETLTAGTVTAAELRPDLFGDQTCALDNEAVNAIIRRLGTLRGEVDALEKELKVLVLRRRTGREH